MASDQCSTPDCDAPVYIKKRGLCNPCYQRAWKAAREAGESWTGKPRPVCSADDCERISDHKGMCGKHYWRSRNPKAPPKRKPLPDELVMRRVTVLPDGCWEAGGALAPSGYGRLGWNGRNLMAHRVILEAFEGPPPEGKPYALHSCDYRPCVNPDHLRWGSAGDNMRDTVARGRQNLGQTKLRAADVRMIRASTETNAALGRKLGVHKDTVGNVRRGQTHRWVD